MVSTKNCKTHCRAIIYSDINDFNSGENGIEIIIPNTKEDVLSSLGYINLQGSGIYFVELTDVKCLSKGVIPDGKK